MTRATRRAVIVPSAGAGGGGGAVAGAPRVIAFEFAFDTPSLADGVPVYTPAIGDLLLDVIVSVPEGFNGTTPLLDVGTFVDQSGGMFAGWGAAINVSLPKDVGNDGGEGLDYPGAGCSLAAQIAAYVIDDPTDSRPVTHFFTATNPLKLVVSQDGTTDGDPIGGTTGAGTLYVIVATPVSP